MCSAIKRKLAEGGDLYVKVQWPISKLDKSSFTKHSDRVDPKLASSTKGAIIVGAKGEIVDGRHRTLASMNSGKKYIEAWVPITDAMSHAK